MDATYRLSSNGEFDDRDDYLRIDNTNETPEQAANQVIDHFGLPRTTTPSPSSG